MRYEEKREILDAAEYMACRTCKAALNNFVTDEGELLHLHPRSMVDLDHEPDPAPMNEVDGFTYICDFCHDPDVKWLYVGDEIDNVPDPMGKIYKHNDTWSVCDPCDSFIQVSDFNRLVERVLRAGARRDGIPWSTASQPFFTQPMVDYFNRFWGAFLPTVHTRKPLKLKPTSMDDIPPSKLPKVRDKLAQLWANREVIAGYIGQQTRGGFLLPGVDFGQDDQFRVTVEPERVEELLPFARRMELATTVADLYWVSDQFTRLAVRAGNKLTDLSITRDELPTANGLIAWESPISTTDGLVKDSADVFAIGWTLVPGGLWLVAYVRSDDFFDDGRYETVQELRERVGWFFPVSLGGGVPFNVVADLSAIPEDAGIEDAGRRSYSMIATLFATWHLMRQKGVSEQTEELPDKATRKAYGRAKRPIPSVKVVDLRSRPRVHRGPAEQPGQRASWSYRVLVGGGTGGFWRTYWTGPGRAAKEQRWIEPYLTGDDGMPMKEDVQIVKALR